jgi:hypothetical protein
MLDTALSWVGIWLRPALLARGFRAGLLRRYPYFYACVASLAMADAVIAAYYQNGGLSARYVAVYWPIEYANALLVLACLSRQISRILAVTSPGVRPLVKLLERAAWLVVGTFTVIFGWAIFKASPSQDLALHRDFDLAEAIVLMAIMWTIFCFDIPLGRHVHGMILGYGTMVAGELSSFAIYVYSRPFLHQFRSLPSIFAFIGDAIWLAALWKDDRLLHPQTIRESVRSGVARGTTRLRRVAIAVRSYLPELRRSPRPMPEVDQA